MTHRRYSARRGTATGKFPYQSIFLILALLLVTVYGIFRTRAQATVLRPLALLPVPARPSVYLPGPLLLENIDTPVLGAETIDARDIITYVNEERMKRGAKPLRVSETLTNAAKMRAEVIMKYQNFSHQDPHEHIQLDSVLPLLSYPFTYASENIGMGDYTARAFVSGFMSSPSHKANLLDPTLVETGVAVASGPYEEYYVNIAVQLFAIPGPPSEHQEYARGELDEYQNLITDVTAQIRRTEDLMNKNVDKKEYYDQWHRLLIRQQEILMTVYMTMREKQPIVDSIVKLIEEYNANWTTVIPPAS